VKKWLNKQKLIPAPKGKNYDRALRNFKFEIPFLAILSLFLLKNSF